MVAVFEEILPQLEKDVQGLDFQALKSLPSKKDLWLESRRACFSASEFHRLMTYENNIEKFPKGAETYSIEKAIESLVEKTEGYSSNSMERGNQIEVEAMLYFIEKTGLEVQKYGENQEFIKLGKEVGATPDGVILNTAGVEGKAPNSKTHFFYITNVRNQEELKKHCSNYYWQCQGGMYVTGFKEWYFFSYDDRCLNEDHKLHYFKLTRNEEDVQKLKSRLQMAIRFKNNYLKQING